MVKPKRLGKGSALSIVALLVFTYHLISVKGLLWNQVGLHLNLHLGCCLSLLIIDRLIREERRCCRLLLNVYLCVLLFAILYIHFNFEALRERSYFNTTLDLVIGLFLIFTVLELTYRTFGPILPLFTLCFMLYCLFLGRFLPGPLYYKSISFDKVVSNLSIGLTNGIYGSTLTISLNYVFLFVIFGTLLQVSHVSKLLLAIGNVFAKRFRESVGVVSVITSALFGSINGGPLANILTTGSFTIPLMKKCGYKAEQAAAIEASASVGGQIMPPVMGAVVFCMVAQTGMKYIDVIKMMLVPAFLYFLSVFFYVRFVSLKSKVLGVEEEVRLDVNDILKALTLFVVPLLAILISLAKGYTPLMASFWGIVCIIVLHTIFTGKEGMGDIIEKISFGCLKGAEICASIACIGMLVTTLNETGLGVKMVGLIESIGKDSLLLTLAVVAVICIIMGCGGLLLSAYFFMAAFGTVPLMKFGVGYEQIHCFIVFLTIFAFLTPPIAQGALVAAKLADANFIKTSIESVKACIGGFLIPFLFVFFPDLLLLTFNFWKIVVAITVSAIFLIILQAFMCGYLIRECSLLERVLLLLSASLIFLYSVTKDSLLLVSGLGVFSLVVALQRYVRDV